MHADCLPSEYQCNDGFCLDGNAIADRKPDCIDQVVNKYYYRYQEQRMSQGHNLFPSREMSIEASDYLEYIKFPEQGKKYGQILHSFIKKL